MAEVYTNPFTVTLTSAYTAGDTSLQVSGAAPSAVQSGTFRVRLGNTQNTLLKVTGGASTTTWTVTAEASDANAASGLNVYGCEATAGFIDAILGQATGLQGTPVSNVAPTDQQFLQYITADSKWEAKTLPLTIGFIIASGATGTNVGPELLAPRAGSIARCVVLVKTSDASVDLTFTIKKNGTSVFTSNQTITHGTAADTLSTITALTSVPLSVAQHDKFTIDITSGSSSWAITAQLES